MYLQRFRLFSSRDPKLRFEDEGYRIFTIVENSTFPKLYPKSGLMKEDCRIVVIPKVQTKFGLVQTAKLKSDYSATKLVSYIDTHTIKESDKNAYIDLTPVMDFMRPRLKRFDSDVAYRTFMAMMDNLDTGPGKKVLLYMLDMTRPAALRLTEMYIAVLIYAMMRRKTMPFHTVMFGAIGGGSKFRKIYEADDSLNSYQKIISTMRTELSHMSSGAMSIAMAQQISEDLDVPTEKVIPIIKTLISDTPPEQRSRLINLANADPKKIREIVVKTSQKMTGHTIIKDLPLQLKKVEMKTLSADMPSAQITQVTELTKAKQPVTSLDISSDLNTHLVIPRMTLNVNSVSLAPLVNHVTGKEFSTTLDVSPNPKFSGTNLIKVKIVDSKTNKTQDIEAIIPNLKSDGSFKMYGQTYTLKKQIASLPVAKYKENEISIETLLTNFKLVRKKVGHKVYINFSKYTSLPLFYYLAAVIGPEALCKKLDIEVTKTGKGLTLQPKGGLGSIISPKMLESTDKDYFKKELEKMIGNRGLIHYLVEKLPEKAIDPSTLDLLKTSKMPTNFIDMIIFAATKLVKDLPEAPNDLHHRRIRSTEVVNKIFLSGLDRALSTYKQDVASGRVDADIVIDPNFVMNTLRETGAIDFAESKPNPVAEIASKNKVNYSGYATFRSENTPIAFRDIHPSQKGLLDPIETAKDSSVGDQLYLTVSPNIMSNNNLFVPTSNPDSMLGYTTSLTPFLESSATARTNMGTSHTKQAVPIVESEAPFVMSGIEGVYKDITSDKFITKSPVDGKVTSIKKTYMTITDKAKKTHKINLVKPHITTGTGIAINNVHAPVVSVGDNVKVKDILAENFTFKGGILAIGKNLLCAFALYNSTNYMDGVIISSHLKESMAVEEISKKVVYVNPETDRILHFHSKLGPIGKNTTLIKYDTSAFNIAAYERSVVTVKGNAIGSLEAIVLKAPKKSLADELLRKLPDIDKSNITVIIKDDIDKTVELTFEVKLLNTLKVGDKFGNKHGNKGVINHIIPEEETPYIVEDGRWLDCVLNPLGLFGRTNWGQYKELLVSAILYEFNKQFVEIYKVKGRKAASEYFASSAVKLNKIKDYDKLILSRLNRMSDKQMKELVTSIKKEEQLLPIHIPPFKSASYSDLLALGEQLNVVKTIRCPELGKDIRALVGYMYFHRLEHLPEYKLNARSTGVYRYRTKQPVAGKKMMGGQRFGEMENWCLLSHDCPTIMQEFKTVQSDDFDYKNKVITQILNGEVPEMPATKQHTAIYDMFKALMTGLHIDI